MGSEPACIACVYAVPATCKASYLSASNNSTLNIYFMLSRGEQEKNCKVHRHGLGGGRTHAYVSRGDCNVAP